MIEDIIAIPLVATVRLSISQTMINWGFFYLYYPQYQLIFLFIENCRSILEARAILLNIQFSANSLTEHAHLTRLL